MAKATRRTTRDVPAKTHPEIPGPPRSRQTLDVGGLERALRKAVGGEVRFDSGSLGLYAQDCVELPSGAHRRGRPAHVRRGGPPRPPRPARHRLRR
ncbi:hypothetical protein GCM10010344_09750 [Streptomyces bluensis]|nr:hypothetical protein GCM10010344_09750 [Streptomyces bluensis]